MTGSRERGEEATAVTAELFRQVPLFSGLAEEDLESLIGVATRRKFPKDAVIFFEHDLGDALFMILSGRVKVTILSDDGREIILAMLSDKDFFGEMSLLDNEPRSATAIAMQETEMVVLHQKDFLSIVEKRPRVLLNLLAVLSSRLRKANQQIGNLALHDVYGRVARVLLEMASESGIRGEDGRVAFRRPTHQEIANMIGATRETVSRMISDLHRQGYIEISGKNVIIHDALTREFAHT
jgi:CRP/FNR family transcriptional regulator/CRP/FNR family cyclic AMP-dependent transcriptional regulator